MYPKVALPWDFLLRKHVQKGYGEDQNEVEYEVQAETTDQGNQETDADNLRKGF